MTRRATVLDELDPRRSPASAPAELRRLGHRPRRAHPGDDATRHDRIEGAQRQRHRAGHGVHPVLLGRGGGEVLTNPQLDPFGKIPEYKFCAARVEPADGRAAARNNGRPREQRCAHHIRRAGWCRGRLCRAGGDGAAERLPLPAQKPVLAAELFFGRNNPRAGAGQRSRNGRISWLG